MTQDRTTVYVVTVTSTYPEKISPEEHQVACLLPGMVFSTYEDAAMGVIADIGSEWIDLGIEYEFESELLDWQQLEDGAVEVRVEEVEQAWRISPVQLDAGIARPEDAERWQGECRGLPDPGQ